MFSLHFRQWSVKLSLFSPTITRQSSNNRTTRAPARRKKGRKRGHPIFGASGHLRFQYGLLKWENNLNNFYNFEQRFAGTIVFSRPMQIKACLLRNNKTQRFALDTFPVDFSWRYVPAKVPFMEPLLYYVVYLCSRIATREACKVVTCCKCCICCFPLFSRICPREGSIHGTRVVFCCLPLQQDCNTQSVKSCNWL